MKIFVLTLSFFLHLPTSAEPILKFSIDNEPYIIEQITSGHGIIWSLEFIADDKILFSEKNGRILQLNLADNTVQFIQKFSLSSVNTQGGLMDIAKSPNFASDGSIYVTYRKEVSNLSTTALAKASFVNGQFSQWTELFAAQPAMPINLHFGSRLAFDKDGFLYMSLGDRYQRQVTQNLSSHHGKIIRLNPENGSAPSDNPFTNTPSALAEIWSFGHRNPQGIHFDSISNQIISSEHGPMGGDEINIIQKGKNYGWPVVTFGREYGTGAPIGEGTSKQGMVDPFKYYTPSIAPANILLYRGKLLPDFKDKYILGGLAQRHLNLVSMHATSTNNNPCEIRIGVALNERVRDIIQGPDELIYFSTDSGRIFRIKKP